MINKKILQLSTYPIVGALTGGPLRVKAINDLYKKHFTDVRHVAIFSKYHHPHDYAPTDIAVTGELAEATRLAANTGDYLIGKGIADDPQLRSEVMRLILDFRPDVIEVEQVFPYIGLRELLKDLPYKPKLVHSSHNIEYPMKQEIMELLGHQPAEVEEIVTAVRQAEEHICREADLVVAVTKADAKFMQSIGALSPVLARNGVVEPHARREDIDYWKHFFGARNINSVATFVGAAHPPNMHGFRTMISTAVGFVPYGSAVVLAGSVGDNIFDDLRSDSFADVTCRRRLINVGKLSHERLQGLLAYTSIVLLPIVEGGGSNLKTAEAIISGKHTVATTKALRSFEEFRDFPTVHIYDEPEAFRQAIHDLLGSDQLPGLDAADKQKTHALLWEECLRSMVDGVSKL
jgi:hypothetical protein